MSNENNTVLLGLGVIGLATLASHFFGEAPSMLGAVHLHVCARHLAVLGDLAKPGFKPPEDGPVADAWWDTALELVTHGLAVKKRSRLVLTEAGRARLVTRKPDEEPLKTLFRYRLSDVRLPYRPAPKLERWEGLRFEFPRKGILGKTEK